MQTDYIIKTRTDDQLLRNDGLGDYYANSDGTWDIVSVKMHDRRHTDLIHIHEHIETVLIREAGIPEEVCDAFDAYFEVLRKFGLVADDAEPGDDPNCPYYEQHQVASKCERTVCEEGFRVSWKDYEKACNEFGNSNP